ncbi:peptidylprolyl isomerase [candidate division KSB1 bacterium]
MNRIVCLFILVVISIIAVSGCSREDKPHVDGVIAEISTTKGLIVAKLEYEKTPMTVANFVGLAEGTIQNEAHPVGTPYFDGSVWGRVVPGHVIQGGSPVKGESRGPGYQFPNEIDLSLSHGKAGMLGMANGGPHTNSSQFYITLGDRSYLDGNYTVFGSVISGMDVVNSIVQGDSMKSIVIVRNGKKAEGFRPGTESFRQMVEEAKKRIEREEKEKEVREQEIIAEKWPDAATLETGVKYQIITEGSGNKPTDGSKLTVRYKGMFLDGTEFYSTAENGVSAYSETAESFEFEIGTNKMNPGFDAALRDMQKGETRIAIIPPEQAYGRGGLYTREREGTKRFVISPYTTLVYEIELLDIGK